ncbi:MAG: uroporphyrinogen decarboxylase family protein [Candidatus Omnitrophota bacterium]
MKSRERVLAAIERRPLDKMPIDCGGMRSTGIMAIAYARLKRHLGLATGRIRVYDVLQQLAEIEPEILELFQVDIVDIVNTSLCPDERAWRHFTLPDGAPAETPPQIPIDSDGCGGYVIKNPQGKVVNRMPSGCLYFETVQPPLGAPRDPVESYNLPMYTDEELAWMRRRAQFLYQNTDYALMGGFGGNILEYGQTLRGWGNFMMDLADGDGFAETLIQRFVEQHLVNLERYLDAVGEFIQLIQMGDDLGTQSAPQVSMETYRRSIHPAHKTVYSAVKKRCPHIKLFFHCCGSCECYIEDLIKEGVEVLNPVQFTAAHMDCAHLKMKYGERITFWGGGCDTQGVLPNATPEEIREHVRQQIRLFAPGGGYVFNPVHNIQANIPPENILAVYEAAKEFRDYPIP